MHLYVSPDNYMDGYAFLCVYIQPYEWMCISMCPQISTLINVLVSVHYCTGVCLWLNVYTRELFCAHMRAYSHVIQLKYLGVDCSTSIARTRMLSSCLDRIFDTEYRYVCGMIVMCLVVELCARTRWVS